MQSDQITYAEVSKLLFRGSSEFILMSLGAFLQNEAPLPTETTVYNRNDFLRIALVGWAHKHLVHYVNLRGCLRIVEVAGSYLDDFLDGKATTVPAICFADMQYITWRKLGHFVDLVSGDKIDKLEKPPIMLLTVQLEQLWRESRQALQNMRTNANDFKTAAREVRDAKTDSDQSGRVCD